MPAGQDLDDYFCNGIQPAVDGAVQIADAAFALRIVCVAEYPPMNGHGPVIIHIGDTAAFFTGTINAKSVLNNRFVMTISFTEKGLKG